jgi:hypothetical protein
MEDHLTLTPPVRSTLPPASSLLRKPASQKHTKPLFESLGLSSSTELADPATAQMPPPPLVQSSSTAALPKVLQLGDKDEPHVDVHPEVALGNAFTTKGKRNPMPVVAHARVPQAVPVQAPAPASSASARPERDGDGDDSDDVEVMGRRVVKHDPKKVLADLAARSGGLVECTLLRRGRV